ncbi:MAG: glycosyl hydrolase family 18 protein [Cytophagaceae bacterium]
MKRITLFAILLCFTHHAYSNRLIAYYANWGDYYCTEERFRLVTDVNWAFLIPERTGDLKAWEEWEWERFRFFVETCPPEVRKFISVGGSGKVSASAFSIACRKPNTREKLIENLTAFVVKHRLDGIDIDWEYPEESDTENLNLFISGLKSSLERASRPSGKIYEISMAVYAGEYGTKGISGYTLKAVDFINIMAYDNDQEVNHSSLDLSLKAVFYWHQVRDMPYSKMVLGVPFYGRPAHSLSRDKPYREFAKAHQAFHNDYIKDKGKWYYNGFGTLQEKVNMALSYGLMGIMCWELSQDRDDKYSLLRVLSQHVNDFECKQPESDVIEYDLCQEGFVVLKSEIPDQSGYIHQWTRNGEIIKSGKETSLKVVRPGVYMLQTRKFNCTGKIQFKVENKDECPN